MKLTNVTIKMSFFPLNTKENDLSFISNGYNKILVRLITNEFLLEDREAMKLS